MRYSKWVLAGICAAFSLTAMISTAGPAARASALALTGPVARAEPQRCLPPLPDVLLEPGMVSQADEAWATRYAPGSLVVKFGPKLGEAVRQQLESDAGELNRALTPRIQELHRELGVAEVIPLFPLAAKLPDPADYPRYQAGNGPLPRIEHIFQVTFTAAVDAAAAAARYAALAGVEYAEPDWIVRAAYAPNDEFYNVNQLWGLFNISAAAAWDVATGAGVTVAVIDTGIYAGHPELAGRIYTNPGEIAGNGVDDDGNGRVDDVHGWDFVANDNNPADGHGHGTHVSGTIAGTADNLYGVAGLAFAAEILPIKGLNDYGSGQTTQLEAALLYAAAMNPDVINNSWGGSGHIQAFQDAIDYAVGLGITVICAAGNNNLDVMDFSPANVETAIAVSAVDRTDTKATYSNFGVKIDVAGPGGFNTTPPGAANPGADVLSTVPPSCYLQTGFGYPVTLGGDGAPYMPISGTSMAAPHVSALAALILELHPGWTPEQVRQVIRQSADDIDAIGFDVNTGYGRIDAAAAVSAFTTPPPVASILTPYNGEVVSGSVTVTGSATATGFVNYVIQLGAGATPTSFTTIYTGASPVTNGTLATGVSTNYADGLYTLRLVTTGPGGVTSEDRNLITIDNFYISSPGPQELFPVNTSSSVTVVGQVPTGSAPGSPQLLGYTLKYAPGENPGSGSFVTIANGTLPVYPEGNIALWDLTSVPDGKVTLRLEARTRRGL